MTTNVFPTPQQLADMLLACNDWIGATVTVEEDIVCGDPTGTYWIALSIESDTKRFFDGFWYDYSNPAEDYPWAARRFAEITNDVRHYMHS